MAGAVDVGDDLRGPDAQALIEAILCLRDAEECRRLLIDLCTIGEVADLALRWKVARMLAAGATYEEVASATGASTATISRIRRFVEHGAGGYRLVASRLAESGAPRGGGGDAATGGGRSTP
ncbi:MAG: helix-turn-helix domain-containing protein [Firmicutes bacterium]|nr:helix-turn-helix domain-containing protein [Bacillota bacterium]